MHHFSVLEKDRNTFEIGREDLNIEFHVIVNASNREISVDNIFINESKINKRVNNFII
jgi:hypothetical protein